MREVDFPSRGLGYLDLARAEPALRNAATLWIADNVELYEGEVRLDTRASSSVAGVAAVRQIASRRTKRRLAHVTARGCRTNMELYWNQGLLDVLFEYPIALGSLQFLDPPTARATRVARGDRCFGSCRPAAPSALTSSTAIRVWCGSIRAGTRPRWRFVELGFLHILDGTDHLLFLLCLVIPFRRFRALVLMVTVVHRRALDHADRVRLRPRRRRAVVSAAHRNADRDLHRLHGAREHRRAARSVQRRWMIAFAFGLSARLRLSRSRCARRCNSPVRHLLDLAAVRSTSASSWGSCSCCLLLIPLLELLLPTSWSPSASARSSFRRWSATPAGTG